MKKVIAIQNKIDESFVRMSVINEIETMIQLKLLDVPPNGANYSEILSEVINSLVAMHNKEMMKVTENLERAKQLTASK